MKVKTEIPSKFTKDMQEKLSAIAEQIVDLEEQIELAEDEKQVSSYKPKPGTEKLVHLSIIRGRRFDENTGKEISEPYVQMFTYNEYQNFIKKAELIGYTIIEELYNPYKK